MRWVCAQEISSMLDSMASWLAQPGPQSLPARDYGMDRHLLEQILPRHVAQLLKEGKEVPPENHDDVTILFTDIVGFTGISSALQPGQVGMRSLDGEGKNVFVFENLA